MVHGLYVEIEPIVLRYLQKQNIHVFYFCGGRGIGKTFGGLDFLRKIGTNEIILGADEATNKFLFVRRTEVEILATSAPETCPFKKYNREEGYTITADYSNKLRVSRFFEDETKQNLLGYGAALSTFANLRGIDFTDVSLIFYDEIIPESKNKRPLRDEGFLFLNMIETINRNRVIEGLPEVVVVLLSNPIDLGADIITQLNMTGLLSSMIFKNQERLTVKERKLHIEKYKDHPVSKLKQESFLYQFAQGTGFVEQSLSGDFVNNDLECIKKVSLSEYTAYMSLENVCIYQHKSNGTLYLSKVMNKAQYVFRAVDREKVRTIFYWRYKMLVVERRVFYDSYQTKAVFESMIGYKPLLE